jgi:hypothetical protein
MHGLANDGAHRTSAAGARLRSTPIPVCSCRRGVRRCTTGSGRPAARSRRPRSPRSACSRWIPLGCRSQSSWIVCAYHTSSSFPSSCSLHRSVASSDACPASDRILGSCCQLVAPHDVYKHSCQSTCEDRACRGAYLHPGPLLLHPPPSSLDSDHDVGLVFV